MSAVWYWLIAVAVGTGLWVMRRELGVGKILVAAVFWPVLIIVVPLLLYRGLYQKSRTLVRSLPGGGGGITLIRDDETYVASDDKSTTGLANAPGADVDIVIPTFGPISEHAPGESPGPPRA